MGLGEHGGECVWAVSRPHLFYKTPLPCCKTTSGTVLGPGPEYQYLWKGCFGEKLLRISRQFRTFRVKFQLWRTSTSSSIYKYTVAGMTVVVYRIVEWFVLEGTFKGALVQPPCMKQGHLQLDWFKESFTNIRVSGGYLYSLLAIAPPKSCTPRGFFSPLFIQAAQAYSLTFWEIVYIFITIRGTYLHKLVTMI